MSRLYLTDQKDEKIHLKFLILASMIETRPEMIGIPPPFPIIKYLHVLSIMIHYVRS